MSTTTPSARSSSTSQLALPALVALLTLMTLELIRSTGPLLDAVYNRSGVAAAAATAVLTYGASGLIAVSLRFAGAAMPSAARGPCEAAPVLVLGAAALGGVRLLVQGLHGDARLVVGLGATACSVAVLTLAVTVLAGRARGGPSAAGAMSIGAAAGVGVQLALGTWDAYWRHSMLGWAVSGTAVALLISVAVLVGRDPGAAMTERPGRSWALGPLLALAAMLLANPAFAASQAGIPLAVAGFAHALVLLVAGWMLLGSRRSHPPVGWTRWIWPTSLVLCLAGVFVLAGDGLPRSLAVLLALAAAQVAALHVLAAALQPGSSAAASPAPSYAAAATACLVGLAAIVPPLVYQLDYDVPLGFPNWLVLVAAAGALAAAGLRRSMAVSGEPAPRRAVAMLLALSGLPVLVGTAIAGSAWAATAEAVRERSRSPERSGVVMAWNVHFAVNAEGGVDPEALADSIAAQHADVVLLQEVTRGWTLAGGLDLATWLSNRLGMHIAFAPAADRQFGNAVLSPAELRDVDVHALPYGDGPQKRSAVSALANVGDSAVRVTSVHLQHSVSNAPTRLHQVESLLSHLTGTGIRGAPGVIGGDFNAEPGSAEMQTMTSGHYLSAVDIAGDPAELTSPNPDPVRRIDWILGRGVTFVHADVLDDPTSDHRPVIAEVDP